MSPTKEGAATAAPSLVAEKFLLEAAEHIAVAESGDAKVAAYHAAAEKILAAREADPDLTYETIGSKLGKSRSWVSTLEKWHQSSAPNTGLPFARTEADQQRKARAAERAVPTQHEDKVEMAAKLMEDPKVADAVASTPSKAQRTTRNAVTKANAAERKKAIEREAQKNKDRAIPLPSALVLIATKMTQMALDMAGLYDDVMAIPMDHPGRSTITDAATKLHDQAERWMAAAEPEQPEIEEGFIEGKVVRRVA